MSFQSSYSAIKSNILKFKNKVNTVTQKQDQQPETTIFSIKEQVMTKVKSPPPKKKSPKGKQYVYNSIRKDNMTALSNRAAS